MATDAETKYAHGQTAFDDWWKQFEKSYGEMRFLVEQAYLLGNQHGQELVTKEQDGAVRQLYRIADKFGYVTAWCDPKNSSVWFFERPSKIADRIEVSMVDDLMEQITKTC